MDEASNVGALGAALEELVAGPIRAAVVVRRARPGFGQGGVSEGGWALACRRQRAVPFRLQPPRHPPPRPTPPAHPPTHPTPQMNYMIDLPYLLREHCPDLLSAEQVGGAWPGPEALPQSPPRGRAPRKLATLKSHPGLTTGPISNPNCQPQPLQVILIHGESDEAGGEAYLQRETNLRAAVEALGRGMLVTGAGAPPRGLAKPAHGEDAAAGPAAPAASAAAGAAAAAAAAAAAGAVKGGAGGRVFKPWVLHKPRLERYGTHHT
jgi:hypothetical protein